MFFLPGFFDINKNMVISNINRLLCRVFQSGYAIHNLVVEAHVRPNRQGELDFRVHEVCRGCLGDGDIARLYAKVTSPPRYVRLLRVGKGRRGGQPIAGG